MQSLAVITQLADEYRKEIELSSGEVTEKLELITQRLVKEVDVCVSVIDMLEAKKQSFWKTEIEFYEAKKSVQDLIDRIKTQLKTREPDALVGKYYKYIIANCAPSLVIDDESIIPQEYKLTTVVTITNKEKLKQDLINGKKVEGARLEGGTKLMKMINK